MADRAYDWAVAAIIVVVALIVVADLITSFIQQNPWFGYLLVGSGVLAAILYGAKKIFYDD